MASIVLTRSAVKAVAATDFQVRPGVVQALPTI
jgi:hypothetical protein